MSETRFTPGPWRHMKSSRYGRAIFSQGGQGKPVVSTNSGLGIHATEADANLIAAAPDLYEACKAALKMRACLSVANNTLGDYQERIEALNRANLLSEQIRAALTHATREAAEDGAGERGKV